LIGNRPAKADAIWIVGGCSVTTQLAGSTASRQDTFNDTEPYSVSPTETDSVIVNAIAGGVVASIVIRHDTTIGTPATGMTIDPLRPSGDAVATMSLLSATTNETSVTSRDIDVALITDCTSRPMAVTLSVDMILTWPLAVP
jgi:hypothetical protein